MLKFFDQRNIDDEQVARLKRHAPDVLTASELYRRRFAGSIGKFFMAVQERAVMSLLPEGRGKRALEVGGAHAQLTPALLRAGYHVVVQSSDSSCFERLHELQAEYPEQLQLVVSSLHSLPFKENTFDAVIAIRLMAHDEKWQVLLREMCRVSNRYVIVDFPPKLSFNVLYPLLFKLKRYIEGPSTRTYIRFSLSQIKAYLEGVGYRVCGSRRELFLPMAFHRALGFAPISRVIERACSLAFLTTIMGSPEVLCAEKYIEKIL